MPFVAWVTVLLFVVIIAAAAAALLQVIFHLTHVTRVLHDLQGGVDAIAVSTAPVTPTIAAVNANLAPVRAWADTV